MRERRRERREREREREREEREKRERDDREREREKRERENILLHKDKELSSSRLFFFILFFTDLSLMTNTATQEYK